MGGFKMRANKREPFFKTLAYMTKAKLVLTKTNLNLYGQMGVDALKDATPKESGVTADSWRYEVVREKGHAKIVWINDNVVGYNTVPVAILIQYGHLNKNGIYIEGVDYINPALRPIFNELAGKIWKEVKDT